MLEDISLFDGLFRFGKIYSSTLFKNDGFRPEKYFNEGDDATAMYVVKSGRMKAYRDRSTGEQLLGYNEPGDLVGEMALLRQELQKNELPLFVRRKTPFFW